MILSSVVLLEFVANYENSRSLGVSKKTLENAVYNNFDQIIRGNYRNFAESLGPALHGSYLKVFENKNVLLSFGDLSNRDLCYTSVHKVYKKDLKFILCQKKTKILSYEFLFLFILTGVFLIFCIGHFQERHTKYVISDIFFGVGLVGSPKIDVLQIKNKVQKIYNEYLIMKSSLLRSQKPFSKSTLSTKVIHDLMHPLVSIQRSLSFDDFKSYESHKPAIKRSINQMYRMLMTLKEKRTDALMVKTYFANDLVNSLKDLSVEIPEKIKFSEDVNKSICQGDIYSIIRACKNLIYNSIEAHAQNVFVKITQSNGVICVEVEDDGVGIPQAVEDMICYDNFTYGKKNGSGQGLAFAQRIANIHRGSLSYKSCGKETKFKFRFYQYVEGCNGS